MDFRYPPYKNVIPDYHQDPPGEIEMLAEKRPKFLLNILMFLLTVGTTLLAGSLMEGANPFQYPEELLTGVPFAGTLLLIIGLHEFGHFLMCRRHDIAATYPFFIPAPTIIGTLGAVIKIKSPITNAKALFDIGAAGPIAGFIVAIPALIIGIEQSEIRETILQSGGMTFGDPLIMKLFIYMVLGSIPDGFTVYISSIAFAGWVGLLVTAFNLLPIGQLDGGHIAYAMFGKKQSILGHLVFYALFPLSVFWWGWSIWIIMALIMKIKHPTGMTYLHPLDTKRKIVGYLCFAMLIVCFMPVPVEGMGLIEFLRTFI